MTVWMSGPVPYVSDGMAGFYVGAACGVIASILGLIFWLLAKGGAK